MLTRQFLSIFSAEFDWNNMLKANAKAKASVEEKKGNKIILLTDKKMMIINDYILKKKLGPIGRTATWCTSKQRVSSMQAQTFMYLIRTAPWMWSLHFPNHRGWNSSSCNDICFNIIPFACHPGMDTVKSWYLMHISQSKRLEQQPLLLLLHHFGKPRCFYSNPRTGEIETTRLVFKWCGFTAPNERTTATRTNMIIPYYKSSFNYNYEIQIVLMYFWFTQIKILSVTGGFKIWKIWCHFSVSAMCSRGRGSHPLSPSPTPRISGGVGVLVQGHQGKVGKIQFDYLTMLRAGKFMSRIFQNATKNCSALFQFFASRCQSLFAFPQPAKMQVRSVWPPANLSAFRAAQKTQIEFASDFDQKLGR